MGINFCSDFSENDGAVTVRDRDTMEQERIKITLIERIRAAGAGLGGFYTPTGVGTEVEQGKETKIINGKKYLLELPLRGNVALVKAYKADPMGNAVFKLTAGNFNMSMATAADTVILEVEKLVPVGDIEPDAVHLPGIFVDYVVLAEGAMY